MNQKPKDNVRGCFYYQGNCGKCGVLVVGSSEESRRKAKTNFHKKVEQHHKDFHTVRATHPASTQRRSKEGRK